MKKRFEARKQNNLRDNKIQLNKISSEETSIASSSTNAIIDDKAMNNSYSLNAKYQ